ncbi:class I SAM-dependent methyltransferase [Zunongwangia sp. SCSIO 43204]|uniref:class I SAM-dependent methyltransferase n=1 Tax=Zunongwangia sp. SCSIO 43204 TaxID=2779359 RepID=UPI001CA8A97E|nr:class I SAM-dependent methyltransferase [Zunongwangia sp. SCSIO 43204]UAB86179.1 class I SAM-dependent methyltransferase [Zunongwangia sp. SCSIO 43204]
MFTSCKVCQGNIHVVNRKFNLAACEKCNLIFCVETYTDNEFIKTYDKLYNSGVRAKYKVHSEIEFNEMKSGNINIGYNRKRFLNKNLKRGDKVLEIGSGNGLVGLYLKNNFEEIDYTGIEIDETTANKAKFFGLNTKIGDYKILQDISECDSFDVIMMWEVLEHIQDLNLCIKLIKDKLKVNGKIILSVPNYDKRLNYEYNVERLYQSGPPIHLNFFTGTALINVFEAFGFKVVKFKKKKFPYLNPKSFEFYKLILKKIFGNYEGSTLYLVALNR